MTLDSNAINVEEYSGIWVFCEQQDGILTQIDFELVSEARRLANELETQVSCLVLGDGLQTDLQKLGGYGADTVYVCQGKNLAVYTTDAYTELVCRIVTEKKPEVLLFGATKVGRDLAPRCAARLGTGLTADCTRLDIDVQEYKDYLSENTTLDIEKEKFDLTDKSLKMTRPAFGGHLMATIICPRFRPCMSTVRPGVLKCGEYSSERATQCRLEYLNAQIEDLEIRVQVEEIVKSTVKKVDFEGAEVIISVGRGIEKDIQKGIALAEELAEAFGGAPIGGSRAVIDGGWLSDDHQIGQTGKTVHPKLYVALGISGAMQHLVGIKDSEYIMAVNKNSDAPIFAEADYGICGDLFKIVPILAEEIRKIRGI